jgi:ferric iron reductase protein FhuF
MELKKLEDIFRISLEDKTNSIYTIALVDLLEPARMTDFLAAYAPLIKARGIEAAAAFFCSWLCSIPLAQQYSISTENKAIKLLLDNLTMQLFPVGEYYQINFKIMCLEYSDAPEDDTARAVWRNQELENLYAKIVRPIFQVLAITSGMDIGQVWGQLPTKFNYYIPAWIAELELDSFSHTLAADYHALIHELDASIFGRKKNPFDVTVRMIEDLRDPGKQIKMKNACCLYYQVGEAEYCYTCPRLTSEERAERRGMVQADQAVAK